MNRNNRSFPVNFFWVACCIVTFCLAPMQSFGQTPTPPQPTPPPGATPQPTPDPNPNPTPIAPNPTPIGPNPPPITAPTPVAGADCTTYRVTATTGAQIVPGTNDVRVFSDDTQTINLPFQYTLYDQTFSSVTIGAHGNLQFGGDTGNVSFTYPCMPVPSFNNTIFAYLDHLHTAPTTGAPGATPGGVFTSISGSAPNRIFNIEWRMFRWPSDNVANFEVRLYEGQKRFDIIYGALANPGSVAVVGVQRAATGGCYTQFSCGQSVLFSGLQLTFQGGDVTPPSVIILSPSPGITTSTFPAISGQAQDNFGGTGIARVEVTIQRNIDNFYWNGSGWSINPATLPAVLTGTSWTLASALPTGPALSLGGYTIRATAYDTSNNSATTAVPITIGTIDQMAPDISISTPADFAKLTSFPAIAGTASDETGGSGMDRVELLIQRLSDGRYWTGSGWNPAPTLLTTAMSGRNWSRADRLPAGSTLLDSDYQIFAYATDKAGNSGGTAIFITVDRTAPTLVSVTAPANGATVNSLAQIRGSATDATGGTGIARVELKLRRASDGRYWDGRAWVITPTTLPSTLTRSNTASKVGPFDFTSTALPKGANLTATRYTLTADAFDVVGNRKTTTISFNYSVVDTIAPAVTVTQPTNGAIVSSLTTIRGSVTDNAGGRGVSRVDLTLQRRSDNKFWTGSTWSTTRTNLTTVLSGSTTGTMTWTRSTGLPTGTNLVDGGYNLSVTATDRANNKKTVTSTFTLRRATTAREVETSVAASPIALSTGAAQAVASSVQLRFNGALDADTASDAAAYRVQVNGRSVGVESAGYNAGTRSVVLGLSEGALRAGDQVVVTWTNLQDAQGRTLSGQSGSIITR